MGHLHADRHDGVRTGPSQPALRQPERHERELLLPVGRQDVDPVQRTAGRTLLAARQRRHAHHRDPNTGHQSRGRHLLGKFLQFQPQRPQGNLLDRRLYPEFPADSAATAAVRPFLQRNRHGAAAQGLRDYRANLARAVPGWRKSGRPHDPDEQHLFDGRRRDGRIERGHKFPLGCLRVAPARHSATDVQHGQAPAPGLGGGL